jgi:hypothetical protein
MALSSRVGDNDERCPWAMSFFLFAALGVMGVFILGMLVFLVGASLAVRRRAG